VVAGVYVCLYDRAGLCWRMVDLSNWHVVVTKPGLAGTKEI
jgi:hypothetical protein